MVVFLGIFACTQYYGSKLRVERVRMVKNQNWRKAVETTDARHQQAKEPAQQQGKATSLVKELTQQFLSRLDQHDERTVTAASQEKQVHLWTKSECSGEV